MLCIIAWHVLIISNYVTKCKRSLNKNKIGEWLTNVRFPHHSHPHTPKIQNREVGSYTLGVAHTIPIFIFLFCGAFTAVCRSAKRWARNVPPPPFVFRYAMSLRSVSETPPVTFILGSHLPTVIFCCIVGPLVRSWSLTLGGLRGRINQHPSLRSANVKY
jgi:hypothetical protein